jgi:hypothetical protein
MVRSQELRKAWVSAYRAFVFSAACSLVIGCGEDVGAERGSGDGGGSDGAAGGAGSSPSARCVDVSHVGALQKKDLRVIGSAFDAYEGLTIRIVATLGEPAYGLGQGPIEGGAFDILLPGVLGDYTGIAVHIDRVRDDACNPDQEFIWQRTTGPLAALGPGFSTSGAGENVWKVTPDTLWVFEQVGPCNLNGIFDLAKPLPCPAES